MAGIDSSIYFQQRPIDVIGSLERGATLAQLSRQREMQDKQMAEQEAIKSAYGQGLKQGPDGKQFIDRDATLAALAKINPLKAYEQQKVFESEDIQKQKVDLEDKLKKIDLGARILSGVNDQASFDKAMEIGRKFGFDNSQFGKYYDPGLVKRFQAMSLDAKERLSEKYKELDYGLKKKSVDLAEKRLIAKDKQGGSGFSVGQKKLDQEFAKDYNDWTSGKSKSARLEINKLKNVADKLKNGNLTTGGMSGMFPDRMTSDELLSARSDVQSTVMNSLRALLGAQFTEKEGDRVIKNTWNEADSTENNLKRLNRLVEDLTAQADAKDDKARYYEQTDGTLAKYKQKNNDSSNIKEWEGNTYKRIGNSWVKQ